VKEARRFFCTECGNETSKWMGRCPACGAWNSLAAAPAAPGKGARKGAARPPAEPVPVSGAATRPEPRIPVGPEGLDRVLGGGLVPGSLVLLSGEPGIGKSTLLLQMAASLQERDRPVLVVSGEESPRQVALRARRLGIASERVLLLPETSTEGVIDRIAQVDPACVVVDSVQTMTAAGVDSAAGSVSQVRAVAALFQEVAKSRGTPVVLVGHVTKDGQVAGPKLLEHLVDVVLTMEGEPGHELRLLRATKNRFGTVAELALFSMTGSGLEPVRNPSAWLLEDRQAGAPGSAVAVTVEGTAPLLVEVQALTVASQLASPRRVARGVEPGRLALLLAVLERRLGLGFGDRDVFVNVVGGLAPREPGMDLAVAAALVSAFMDRPLPPSLALFGEVGLLGEVRGVGRAPERVREAAALGFGRIALPARDRDGVNEGVVLLPQRHVGDLLTLLGDDGAGIG